MFHVGKRVRVSANRRKRQCKKRNVENAAPSPSVLASLSEAMNGLSTEAKARRPRRATRLSNKGSWQAKPSAPRCERPAESPLNERVAFTVGESVKERRRNRSTRREDESRSVFNNEGRPSIGPESDIHPPDSFFEEAKNKVDTQKAEELKSLGNEALNHGRYTEARELYSKGMELIMGCTDGRHRLMSKLYSNRAAAYLSEDDPQSALNDCLEAKKIHPKNVRAYTRGATCCTRLGDFDGAIKILDQACEMLSASDPQFRSIGKQKAFVEELKSSLEMVALRCADGEIDDDVLSKTADLCSHVQHFERVWRLAALVYLQTHEHDKLQTIEAKFQNATGESRCWWKWIRMEAVWWDCSQNLTSIIDVATSLLHGLQSSSMTELETTPQTPSITIEGLKHVLDELKNADRLRESGKSAVGQRNYTTAERLYSEAIGACEAVGCPKQIISVLYCNRGAALHGQGRYVEAMSDVSIAICLHPVYSKAYLRLAQMHLESRNPTAAMEIAREGRLQLSLSALQEIQALTHIEQKAQRQSNKEEQTRDAYRIMGLANRCSDADVKKTFRKLALKLHPDKAAQFVKLKLSWMGDTPFVRKQEDVIRHRLHDRLQQLFKLLNSAHSILIDKAERALLDEELVEEAREACRGRRRNHCYESYYYYTYC